MSLTINAPAKINLFLDVLDKRDDGYHNIFSVMQSIDLCDKVTVKIFPSHAENYVIHLKCSDASIPQGEKNIAYKAASAYLDYISADSVAADIFIEKNIPASAGLAGGSTDAAAVLILLNRLYGNILPLKRLCGIGQKIGADVPFCIHSGISGGAMTAEGIGEILTPCKSLSPDVSVVVCVPDIQISTVWAYSELDRLRKTGNGYENEYSGYNAKTGSRGEFFNIFEEGAVLPSYPVIGEIKRKLIKGGAYASLMSGSGASVFGLFSDREYAVSASQLIKKEVPDVRTFLCSPYVSADF